VAVRLADESTSVQPRKCCAAGSSPCGHAPAPARPSLCPKPGPQHRLVRCPLRCAPLSPLQAFRSASRSSDALSFWTEDGIRDSAQSDKALAVLSPWGGTKRGGREVLRRGLGQGQHTGRQGLGWLLALGSDTMEEGGRKVSRGAAGVLGCQARPGPGQLHSPPHNSQQGRDGMGGWDRAAKAWSGPRRLSHICQELRVQAKPACCAALPYDNHCPLAAGSAAPAGLLPSATHAPGTPSSWPDQGPSP